MNLELEEAIFKVAIVGRWEALQCLFQTLGEGEERSSKIIALIGCVVGNRRECAESILSTLKLSSDELSQLVALCDSFEGTSIRDVFTKRLRAEEFDVDCRPWCAVMYSLACIKYMEERYLSFKEQYDGHLMDAVRLGRKEIVTYIVKKGVSPRALTEALLCAKMGRKQEIANYLASLHHTRDSLKTALT